MTDKATTLKVSPLPDLGDIIFLTLVYLMLYLRPDLLFADGSTGWHIVTGNFILAHNQIPHHDLISYTFANQAWVAYEWLADLVMAIVVKLGGLNLLAVVSACSIALLSLLLYGRCRKEGGHFFLVATIVVVGSLVASIHWLARPHLITFFGLYLFSTRLEDYYRGRLTARRLLIVLPLFMLIWVNSHPGFLFGLAILIIYTVCAAIEFLLASKNGRNNLDRLQGLVSCLLISSAVTVVNPYFLNLYTYIFKYLRGSTVLAATDEFTSPIFHGDLQPACLEILFALFVTGLAITKRPLSFPTLMVSLAFGHLSLSSQRNMPLFAIVILPAIARLFSQTIFSPTGDQTSFFPAIKGVWQGLIRKLQQVDTEFTENEKLSSLHLFPIGLTLLLAVASICGGHLAGFNVIDIGFDPTHKPVKTLTAIHDLKLDARHGLCFDNWGGYINYKTGMPVFIDDRADFYGEPFYFDYGIISQTTPGWPEVLTKYKIDWILFPNNSRLVEALINSPEWRLSARDEGSSLFVRKPKPSN
jgi:hypothetical protein